MSILQTADIRGFYDALGVELPGWAQHEAPAHCFASPGAHSREDRSPSSSVNLESGAWCCHGCGAHGGAYDAALAIGHTPRTAIELMITHGLIEPRTEPRSGHQARHTARAVASASTPEPRRMALAAGEADVLRWQDSLQRRPALLARLEHERGWSYPVLRTLEIGIGAGGRLTIPIRNHAGELRGILRYDPWRTHEPKMLAIRGTRLGLVPHPAREPSRTVLLVEGPPDMLAARSRGLPAIAVPGTHAWRPEWATLLRDRRVTVVMDCDSPGREAARRIATDLGGRVDVRVLDLDPRRHNGYDLTDALLDHAEHTLSAIRNIGQGAVPSVAMRRTHRVTER